MNSIAQVVFTQAVNRQRRATTAPVALNAATAKLTGAQLVSKYELRTTNRLQNAMSDGGLPSQMLQNFASSAARRLHYRLAVRHVIARKTSVHNSNTVVQANAQPLAQKNPCCPLSGPDHMHMLSAHATSNASLRTTPC